MNRFIAPLFSTALLALASTAFAQETPSVTEPAVQDASHHAQHAAKKAEMKQKLESMTPEERAQFKQEHKAKLKERYENATPEEQAKMKERYQAHKARRGGAKDDAEATNETSAQ